MTPQHVLVTGGAGFIGSHVVDRLISDGHRVTVLDDFSTGDRLNLATHLGVPELVVVEADVAHPLARSLRDAIARQGPVERVVHLAAQTSVVRSLEAPLDDLRVNAGGTLQVLELARAVGARRVVFASSAAVYGDAAATPVDEDQRTAPTSPYGAHKLASEHYLAIYRRAYGVSGAALRFFNVYGPRQDPSSPYSGVISIFIERASRGLPLTVFGDGEQTRDFVYVGDVVEAVVRALFAPAGVAEEPMNVGTGREVTVNALAAEIVRLAVSQSEIVHAPARAGEILRSVASIDRISDRLGFTPTVTLAQGLDETVRWFAARRASVLA